MRFGIKAYIAKGVKASSKLKSQYIVLMSTMRERTDCIHRTVCPVPRSNRRWFRASTRPFAAGKELDTAILLHELAQTRPLSVTMAERIATLRQWAAERCVSAD